MNMSYLENVVTSNNQLLILAQQFGQLFHLLLNYLENVASSDTTLELCLTSGETFLAPLKSYIAAEISGNALWGALVRGTRILVSTVNAIFVLNFFKDPSMNQIAFKREFWRTKFGVKYLLENVVSSEMCTAVLNKVWMKRKKCIFHIPNLFSLFWKPPAAVFEICQNRNKNWVAESSSQRGDIFLFDWQVREVEKIARVALYLTFWNRKFKNLFYKSKKQIW